jgi:hypothetical protein
MEFRILGTLEAEANGRRLALGGPSEQKVLAVLLLAANRVVSLASMVDTLWEDDPPATAAKQAFLLLGALPARQVSGEAIAAVSGQPAGQDRVAAGGTDGVRPDPGPGAGPLRHARSGPALCGPPG